jgi:hypothetical protein
MLYEEVLKPIAATPELPSYVYDGSLLFHCMELLQIDRGDLAYNDPLLFRELQGVCALCRSKDVCAHDVSHLFDNAQWDRWVNYCPNAPTLTLIGAVQNCGHAAQSLKMPKGVIAANLR